jgi:tRNA pseudouridine38-40 synthase
MQLILDIAYKGTNYHGWQIQKNAFTIQEALNQALSILLQSDVDTFGSGRTDTGVHAEQQFVQLINPNYEQIEKISPKNLLFKLNALLPKDIVIKYLYMAEDNFSVRHDAVSRSYEYRISQIKNPFLDEICSFYFQPNLDIDLMNEAACLMKTHTDFQSFSKYHSDVSHFNCEIKEAFWRKEEKLLVFQITANRFLRGMVRAIVGTMLEIGRKKVSLSAFEQIIQAKDRKVAKFAAAPQGLFLTKVIYDSHHLNLLC